VPTLELRPESVVAGGEALARDADGRVVLVSGALPGERVTAEVTEEHRSYAKARVIAVLEASPDRLPDVPCPHVGRGCGGCSWQHVGLQAQVRAKVQLVEDALRRLGKVADPVVRPGPVLPAEGHRTTVRLAVDDQGRAGYRRGHSHEVVDVDSCLVAHPLLAELLEDARFPGATEVTLRAGARTGERLALVHPTAEGVHLPDDVLVVGADELHGGRRAWFHEEAAGRRWRVSARSFFQARPDGAEALVDAVREAVDGAPDGALLDAYGGVGLFAGTVAGDRRVTLIERSASSVADARVNLGKTAHVLRLDVEKWRPAHAAVVVADPARTGLGKGAVDRLAATGAGRLVLVSCDAAALGRDAALLDRAGYELTRSTVVDLFPHTPHVEVVSTFVSSGGRTGSEHRPA
jgi:23S rRNA (uracil1939-C5)-methyltransferase